MFLGGFGIDHPICVVRSSNNIPTFIITSDTGMSNYNVINRSKLLYNLFWSRWRGRRHIILASLSVLRSSRGVYSNSAWIRYHKSYRFDFFEKPGLRVSRHGLCHDQYRCSWISCLGSSYVWCITSL